MSTIPPQTSRRGTNWASNIQEIDHGSYDFLHSRHPTAGGSEAGTTQPKLIAKLPVQRKCVLWIHDESLSTEDIILNFDLFPSLQVGDLMAIIALKTDSGVRDFQDTPPAIEQNQNGTTEPDVEVGNRCLFIAKDMSKEMKVKQPSLEVSVTKHVADVYGLKPRCSVMVTTIDPALNSASHVELSFKDEYLARSDMWRLALAELSKKVVFKGQNILFMGTIKAQVTSVYVNGYSVKSAFFSTETRSIFRSGSARYVLFIQMSREMWDFDSEGSGEILFSKVINGFLPTLFKKWAALRAKHLVSIVLFTRVEYDTGLTSKLGTELHDSSYHTGIQTGGNKRPYKDFYRVVVSEMASGSWTKILYKLKREFKFFRRDISMYRIDLVNTASKVSSENDLRGSTGTRIEAEPSLAMHGNVLEAINLAASQFAQDYIDRDLMRTGISIVVITPSPGLFEVDYEALKMTTETLIGNGIGIDLVCLPKMPLHSVPLFRFKNPLYTVFQEELHLNYFRSQDSTPRQNNPIFGSSFSSLNEPISPTKESQANRGSCMGSTIPSSVPSEWSYAIPHWIDVSFWTGASQESAILESLAKHGQKDQRKYAKLTTREFEVRCKMYEMEQASAIESMLTEISVSPLRNDAFYPQMVVGPRNTSGQRLKYMELAHTAGREKSYACLFHSVSGPTRPLADRHTPPDHKRVFMAVDSSDSARLVASKQDYRLRQYDENKKHFKTGSEETAMKLLAEDPKVFGTSLISSYGTAKTSSFISRSLSGRDRRLIPSSEDTFKPRKDAVKILAPSTPLRPPKISRHISLGKHGFGIAAPKAAIPEIQTQNANAAQLTSVNQKTSSQRHKTNTVANTFLNSASSQIQTRPPSSQSERLKMKENEILKVSNKLHEEADKEWASRPMTIKSALQNLDCKDQLGSRSILGSLYDGSERHGVSDAGNKLHSAGSGDTQKLYNSKLLAGSVPELPTTLSPTTALSPWLSILNPSHPADGDLSAQTQHSRWQHVFPKPAVASTMKWKSLCSPASVPLTTEYFPTKDQLETEYEQKPHNIAQNTEEEFRETPKARKVFLQELIGLRLSQGFQVVVGPAVAEAVDQKSLKIADVFDPDCIAEDGASVFMSMGATIHQLSYVNETAVEIKIFVRKPTTSSALSPRFVVPRMYNPAVRTTLADQYGTRQIILGKSKDDYNWNYVDAFISGFDDKMTDSLRFWRARFVLIPVESPSQVQRHQGEDNEEEIRLEGIRKLTMMWQKHRVLTNLERRHQNLPSSKVKDLVLNPLDIVYKTEDPSVVVTAEIETLPLVETGDAGARRGQLIEAERFSPLKLDYGALADAIQAPIERGGVRMQNRRWHFRLHYNCFIGSDMTSWLIEHFENIETREEAVELGNKLMAKDELPKIKEKELVRDNGKEKDSGLFCHVEKRHPFRDGQYFYQVTGEFARQRPESRSGWFSSKRRDTSIPSTPLSESMMKDNPRPERSRSSSNNHDDRSSDPGTTTPTVSDRPTGKKPKVALSKVMSYDVDHRKRSYRPERINLHYDRLHNPDNCYHIRIDWMNVTAKLIDDAIGSWASTAERYGLRLVEAPVGEACSIADIHPFRSPYLVKIAAQPPNQQPRTYFDINSFAPQIQSIPASRHYYQKAIMKKFNFVLDIEAASNFPNDVEVTYSWGRPDFKYSQYIHRSGIILAQITDEGNFLLLANRLYNNRTLAKGDGDKFVRNDNTNRSRMVTSAFGGHGIISDKTTPINSPLLQATTAHISSPLLRAAISSAATIAVSNEVLGGHLLHFNAPATTTPESIKNELETFCKNQSLLENFYKEVLEKSTPPNATPPIPRSPLGSVALDSSIPALGLPPNILARDTSPSPMRLGVFGRRPSVHTGGNLSLNGGGNRSGAGSGSGESGKQDSPRGCFAEVDRTM